MHIKMKRAGGEAAYSAGTTWALDATRLYSQGARGQHRRSRFRLADSVIERGRGLDQDRIKEWIAESPVKDGG